jgi:1,4-alpha-glucan branching enzyme
MAKTKTTNTRRVVFSVQADPESIVYLAGSFNNWDPQAKEMTDKKHTGLFSAAVMLQPGTHEYKFVINGTWCVDPTNSDWTQNSLGTLNSVLVVEA